MIARVDRRVPVRIARQQGTNQYLGRVALKTCLSAICHASPELLLDKHTDYIVYAVDPQEAPSTLSSSTTSPRRAHAPVFVGKGFFSGGLEEPGDGTSFVTGPIRAEPRHGSAFSSDEDDASHGTDMLEIVLRLKEASQRGREQYQTRLRSMAAATSRRETGSSGATSADDRRAAPSAAATPPAAPSVPASPSKSRTPSQQVLQVLQAMQAHQGHLSAEQQTQLMGLLGLVAGAVQSGALPAAKDDKTPPRPEPKRSSRPGLRDTRTDLPRICYNCGTTSTATWRILTLPAGATVQYPASERPPTDAVPLTWTPQYGTQGPVQTHGEARWQACNPCGLYFAKYGVARPDYVRNFVARPGRDEKKRGDAPAPAERGGKRARAPSAGRTASSDESRPSSSHDGRALDVDASDKGVSMSALSIPSPRVPSSPSAQPWDKARPGAPASPAASLAGLSSSPHTMLQTLMHETDPKWQDQRATNALFGVSPGWPVRRSPRKQPPGTVADVNPYATVQAASSPTTKKRRPVHALRDALTSPGPRRSPRHAPSLTPLLGTGALDDDGDALGGGPPSPSAGRTSRARPAPKRELRTPSRMPREQWAPPASPGLGVTEPWRLTMPAPPALKDLLPESTPPAWLAAWDSVAPPRADGASSGRRAVTPLSTSAAMSPRETEARADAGSAGPAPERRQSPPAAASQALVARAPRKPLPATVEDAPSSPSNSPGTSSDADDNLVDLIEDPYGLLAACGIGLPATGGDAGAQTVSTGGQGFSMDAFNGIELHNAPAFAQHLEAFTQSGGLGVAAHTGPMPGETARSASATPAALPGPHVCAFGSVPEPVTEAPTGDLDAFLDDPTVQAMLSNLSEPVALAQ